ncbi:O-phosphoseryl-tRNA(Sec) selenium transferase [Anopheles ziemanni]|uniref:O-phosphoseryl-tRNA(Sec) selenium transferase n=1 Tax=Anopheles coustani TaxID=139045 RepID=UPI00265A687D|nr:O-phosphoseryl-tRNA(Sec) selenium transferase [Anopheles coustani]XP_058169422.1 O-phosphoseryl-tRNA(Sec) selenium transferase [Anopheles ziemanni]
MNDKTINSIAESLVPKNYLSIANDARQERDKLVRILLEKKKIPHDGWNETTIEYLIAELAMLDSNNFNSRCGVGEREGRVICDLVRRRHYNFAHGIGRSGNLTAAQPKAAGSTLMANLTNSLVRDLIRTIGVPNCSSAAVVPMATGMTVMLTLRAIHVQRPDSKFVLWSRVDQQSCFKSILAAGLTPIVIDSVLSKEHTTPKQSVPFATDLAAFETKIQELGVDKVCCLLSTTSCFAPRNSDDILELAKLSAKYNVPHVVNNAYGLQSTFFCHQLERGSRAGRIDAFIQSTDKNLLVPVGGAIVAGFDKTTVDSIARLYPGRASGSQSLDVLLTLLTLGVNGYRKLMNERKELHQLLLGGLSDLAKSYNERILPCNNPISIAMTLETFKTDSGQLEMIGSMLQKRGVSGCRVVTTIGSKTIDGHLFTAWGAHSSMAQVPYLTCSAALGITRDEISHFLSKLNEVLRKYRSKYLDQE